MRPFVGGRYPTGRTESVLRRTRDLLALAAVAAWCFLIVELFPAPAPAPPAVPYANARAH